MKYKLMAVDVDGTLLDSHGNISEHQKEVIKKAVAEGLVFAICSGRPVQSARTIALKLDEDLPLITYNGGLVITGKSRTIIYEEKLDPVKSKRIFELGKTLGTSIIVWVDHELYVWPMSEAALAYGKAVQLEPKLITDFDEIIGKGAHKLLFADTPERIEKMFRDCRYLEKEGINAHPSKPIYLEFVDTNVTKSNGIRHLAERYGITMEEVIAAGDSYNDLSMLQSAGLSVAMENAPEDIKAHADFITKSNDEDGIAHVIEKFILQ